MTKPRPKWPGDLGKPIRQLPVQFLTHGGRITKETVAEYNRQVIENIERAKRFERLRKLPLLAAHYGVGAQNYAGIAKCLAGQFIRNFDGDVGSLRNKYKATDYKSLALMLAVKFCKGFEYIPPFIKAEVETPLTDETGKLIGVVAVGGIRSKLVEGRPEQWCDQQLEELMDAVTAAKKPGMSDVTVLTQLKRRRNAIWKNYDIKTLQNRLYEARAAKKIIERNVKKLADITAKIISERSKSPH